jgi:hypothetical protein
MRLCIPVLVVLARKIKTTLVRLFLLLAGPRGFESYRFCAAFGYFISLAHKIPQTAFRIRLGTRVIHS